MSSRLTPYGALLRSTVLAGVAAAALAGCGMMGRSDTARFGGTLNGASEVPPNMARGTGMAEAWLDKNSNVLKWKVTYSGLSGPATAGHFHGPASAGANAGVGGGFQGPEQQPDRRPDHADRVAGGRPDGRQVVCQHPHSGQSGRRDPRPDASDVGQGGVPRGARRLMSNQGDAATEKNLIPHRPRGSDQCPPRPRAAGRRRPRGLPGRCLCGTGRPPEQPQWIAGVSIGAINAALIAGNPPEQRVARLRAFWELVSSGPAQRLPAWLGDRAMLNQWSANWAVLIGIPGFFDPRRTPEFLRGAAARVLSYYDTAPLKATLERLIDFDRINAREMRFSVGAVNVRTGNSIYFDNVDPAHGRIGPEHVMASGALPPGFAPVHIAGEDYWDGGVVSNTPLQYVLDQHPRSEPLLALQVDLFSARGAMPQTLAEVAERQKDITYSSRTRFNTDALAASFNLEQSMSELMAKLPAPLRSDPTVAALMAQFHHEPIDIVHLIYRDKPYELESKDYEFSRAAVDEHWEAGERDMRQVLAHPDCLRATGQQNGVTVYDLQAAGHLQVKHPMRAPVLSKE